MFAVVEQAKQVWCLDWCLRKRVSSENLFHTFAVVETIEETVDGSLLVTR